MIGDSYEIIDLIKDKYKENSLIFEFGIHDFIHLSERKIVNIPKNLITKDFLNNQITDKDRDLSIHCWVIKDESDYFIPMIDFSSKATPTLPDSYSEFHIYSSGQSYHGYNATLIPAKEWYSYMEDLFSLEDVDHEWISHSLMNGFASLRLSSNIKLPIKKIII